MLGQSANYLKRFENEFILRESACFVAEKVIELG